MSIFYEIQNSGFFYCHRVTMYTENVLDFKILICEKYEICGKHNKFYNIKFKQNKKVRYYDLLR